MALLFSHLSVCLTHVYNFKSVFNFTITKLSWHVLCYLISKNLYSLQNAQPFIFQLIFILKAHNKKLNQYCLNFIIFFFLRKKKVLKKWFGFESGWVDLQKTRVGSRVNPFLLKVKKIKFRSSIFRVGSAWVRKFWPVLPCLTDTPRNLKELANVSPPPPLPLHSVLNSLWIHGDFFLGERKKWGSYVQSLPHAPWYIATWVFW